MGFRFTARCPECDYRASGLVVGDGKRVLFTCRACRSIVNPERQPFRANTPDCPGCGVALPASDAIDPTLTSLPILRNRPDADPKALELLASLGLPEPPPAKNPRCPRCEKVEVALDEEMHFSIEVTRPRPKRGDRIHATYDAEGVLHVPDLDPVRATFAGPAPPKERRVLVELEVISGSPLVLAFRRKLEMDAESRLTGGTKAPPPAAIARRPPVEREKAASVLRKNRFAVRTLIAIVVLLVLVALGAGGLWLREVLRARVLVALEPGLVSWRKLYPTSVKPAGEPFLRGKVIPINEENARVVDHFYFDLPAELRPNDPAEVGTVLWLERSNAEVSKGDARFSAWRRVWRVRLVTVADGQLVAVHYFKGSEPENDPTGESYGGDPIADVAAWLGSLPRR